MEKEIKDDIINLSTESMVCEGDMLYFIAREIKVLFSYSYNEDKIRMLSIVPDEEGMIERQFISICKCGSKLILAPYNAKRIWIFDTITENWECIEISKFVSEDAESKFSGCVCFQNKVCFFGYSCPSILILDMESMEINYIYNYLKDEKQWGQKIAISHDKAYVAYSNKKEICVIDFKTQKVDNIKLDVSCDGFSSVGYDKNGFVLVPVKGNSLYYAKTMDQLIKFNLPEQFKNNIYNGVEVNEKYIYLYSSVGKSYVIDRLNEKNSFVKDEKIYYVGYLENKGFIESRKGLLRFYNENLQIVRDVQLKIDRKTLKSYYNDCTLNNIVYKENDKFNIDMYINKVING